MALNTPTRRAVLGAIMAAPVVLAVPVTAVISADRTVWDRAHAEYKRHHAEWERLCVAYTECDERWADAGYDSDHLRLLLDEADDATSEYGKQYYFPAREALMEIPAPDERALLVKLNIALTSLDDDHAESTRADAQRILGKAV